MHDRLAISRGVRSALAGLLLLAPATAWGDQAELVQQVGTLSGAVAEASALEITVVPFSRRIDARTTPFMLAPGKAFVARAGKGRVGGLSPAERKALRQAYRSGQTIVVPEASVHDVEALHTLLRAGVAHDSSTDPVMLACALRQEAGVPTARVVVQVRPQPPDVDAAANARAFKQAIDIVVEELSQASEAAKAVETLATAPDWADSPVQSTTLTSTTNGTFNTPVKVYALHSCEQNMDYYLVDTGGDWTATEARYQSASEKARQIRLNEANDLEIDWQDGKDYRHGGIDVSLFGDDERICRYANYPLFYEVDIVPPVVPTVVQDNAAPEGDQGQSSDYTSGFTFSIGGGVNVSGTGPSAGLQAGVTWNNEVSSSVPPLVVNAGDKGNEGTFTKYFYCVSGRSVEDCSSTIQMVGAKGACRDIDIGDPEQGQTPAGRLSNVAQTVNWQVDPTTYDSNSTTFDITVTSRIELADSVTRLWWGPFFNLRTNKGDGPSGYCNRAGCSCSIRAELKPLIIDHTLKVPFPSTCPAEGSDGVESRR